MNIKISQLIKALQQIKRDTYDDYIEDLYIHDETIHLKTSLLNELGTTLRIRFIEDYTMIYEDKPTGTDSPSSQT